MATAEGHSPRGDAQSRSNGDKLGPSPLNVCPERGPCKRAGVLILAKKSHLLIHLGITLLFLLLPLSPLLSHDYHLGPAGKGSKRKKTFFSAAKRPHSLSSGTCEVAALPRFLFWKMTPCAARSVQISLRGATNTFPLLHFFALHSFRTLVDRSYEDVCFLLLGRSLTLKS